MVYAYGLLNNMYRPLSGDATINSNASAPLGESDVEGYVSGAVESLAAQSTVGEDELASDDGVFNVLLVGSEAYGNSDTMILLSLDEVHQKLKMTSFLRDTWVAIPGLQDNRLNAAYSYGGTELAIETIERNFGVNIDKYARVDFDMFKSIVEILGGVEITITDEEAEYLNEFARHSPTLPGAGTYILTPEQALEHVRNRTSGSWYDFGRTERQRNFLTSLIERFKGANIAQMGSVLVECLQHVETDIPLNQMSFLLQNADKYLNYEVEQYTVPATGSYTPQDIYRGGYTMNVLVLDDMEQTREDLKEFIYGDTGGLDSTSSSFRE